MPSEKILEQKQQQVAALKEAFEKANVGVLVNYNGITVEKDTKLRKQLPTARTATPRPRRSFPITPRIMRTSR